MQMARWFGYHLGYEKICRLYLPEQSWDHYEFITDAIEELRGELKRMGVLKLTPEDFGLKVRHSPAAIRITAANKMRTATSMMVAQDYSGRHIEGYALVNDRAVNRGNRNRVSEFLIALGEPDASGELVKPAQGLFWRAVRGADVLKQLRAFNFSESGHVDLSPIDGSTSLFEDYVSDRIGAELDSWDVLVPTSATGVENRDLIPGRAITLRKRQAGVVVGDFYKVTGKNKAANPGDEKLALSPEQMARAEGSVSKRAGRYCVVRDRPLLLVHLFNAEVPKAAGGDGFMIADEPVVTLSFCLPETRVQAVERQYQVNAVYRRQMEELATETDDDEVILDESDAF
jgi:hypothetical protein